MNQSNKKGLQQPLNVASPKAPIPNRRMPQLPRLRRRNRRLLLAQRSSPGISNNLSVRNPGFVSRNQVGVAAAYSSSQLSSAPRIFATRDSSRIIHRELISSITGTTNFSILAANTFALNPGLASTFPWLSTQAQGWERYRFDRLRFCYYTRTGSNIPGSVQMIPDYDAADAAPISEQVASSYEDVKEDAPWKDIECELRPSALNALGPSKFVRTGPILVNQDIKTYDAGNFFLATTDGTAVSWGKLWVEYDITLMTPQLQPNGANFLAVQGITTVNPTSANMLGTQAPVAGSSNLVTVVGEVVTFLVAGTFHVYYHVNGTTSTQTGGPAAGAGGAVIQSIVSGSGAALMYQWDNVTMLVGSTLTYNNTLAAGTSASLVVYQVPSTLGPC